MCLSLRTPPPARCVPGLAMKVAETLLVASVLGLAGFIGVQVADARSVRNVRTHAEAAGAIEGRAAPRAARPGARTAKGAASDDARRGSANVTIAELPDITSHILGNPVVATPRLFADAGNAREMRRRIAEGSEGTYMDDLLVARDSSLTRWADRLSRPLRVWVEEAERLQGWDQEFTNSVRDAFDTWRDTGIPVRFDFIRDSATADIHVRFSERLANGISGKTVWSRDARWWLVSSDIQLGLVHPSGGVVTPVQMRAIALHEVGHLLGLDHSGAADDIMSARVRVRELSDPDRATVRLLYSMPAGTIKQK